MVASQHLLALEPTPPRGEARGNGTAEWQTRPDRHVDDATVQQPQPTPPADHDILPALGPRSIVLVGMMGAGKSSIGRKLAQLLGIAFVDADSEIETAAQMTIPEIFAKNGEPYFRAGEARVISRLLDGGPQVLATGGGAFMREETREAIRRKGISVWLKADFDVLMRRVRRRTDRPMLKTDSPAETLKALIAEREPVYATADITVWSRDVPHELIVGEIVTALRTWLNLGAAPGEAGIGEARTGACQR
jgi:shikimate kinase